jgi:hypothetical protein
MLDCVGFWMIFTGQRLHACRSASRLSILSTLNCANPEFL